MKTHEIVGFKRANLGKTEAQELRSQGYVPSVLYGGTEQVHFYAPAMLFRELLFTPDILMLRSILRELYTMPFSRRNNSIL